LRFGLGRLDHSLFGRCFFGPRQIGDNSFCSGGSKRLRDGLLSTAPPSPTPTTAAAATPTRAFSTGDWLALLLGSLHGFFASGLCFQLTFGSDRNFCRVMARLNVAGRGHFARSLIRVEICRLQWRRRRLTSLLRGFLLTAL
jgi:hypothetical protein